MAGISIPGVSDKYKTNDIVEGLMKVERVPLTREQETLEKFKSQQDSWRSINQKMSSLRDSVKTLYSFENPFNNKLADSTAENSITATAGREARYESFKIDVINPATADRFLSADLKADSDVKAGTYTYKTDSKTISIKWKGGKISDFVNAINKRGGDAIKASLIGISKDKKALMIESLKTGEKSKLMFQDDALDFAIKTEMISKVVSKTDTLGNKASDIKPLPTNFSETKETLMPSLTSESVKVTDNGIALPPRSGFTMNIPESVKVNPNSTFEFTLSVEETKDITIDLNERANAPELPDSGYVQFKDVRIDNNPSDTTLPIDNTPKEILDPIENSSFLFIRKTDGTEEAISIPSETDSENLKKIKIDLKDYPNIQSLVIRNTNTGKNLNLSKITVSDSNAALGYEPKHAVSRASDAVLKYEGITITRPENTIDDIVPNVTLNITDKTDKTATITIKPDTESAKEALINFVGKYNQTVAEINILSQNKPEVISELDYLSSSEKEEYTKKLGLFFNDFSLSSAKNSMQQIITGTYNYDENAPITMLSQTGISTSATSYAGYNPGKMRGYLEIDEKKLDENLSKNLDAIKSIFGFDSDGDLIIDSGIGYALDKQLTAYVQTGGVLANKTKTLDRQIETSQGKISKLETQLDKKEAELRQKYGIMESTLNKLEGQQGSIENFSKQNNGSR